MLKTSIARCLIIIVINSNVGVVIYVFFPCQEIAAGGRDWSEPAVTGCRGHRWAEPAVTGSGRRWTEPTVTGRGRRWTEPAVIGGGHRRCSIFVLWFLALSLGFWQWCWFSFLYRFSWGSILHGVLLYFVLRAFRCLGFTTLILWAASLVRFSKLNFKLLEFGGWQWQRAIF